MKKVVLYGITREIEAYDPDFIQKIDYIVEKEAHQSKKIWGVKVEDTAWLRKQNDVFIIISNIYNKQRSIRELEEMGYAENIDFVWAPEWYGNECLPSCYPLKSWEENEKKYDFSKEEGPWDFRYKELLTLLPKSCKSVLDCGAGNMSLKGLLRKEIDYYPIDKTQKFSDTIVCDFNSDQFPEIDCDVAFLCGILEYVTCPEIFVRNVCRHVKTVLMSYCSLYTHADISGRMLAGWKNHFTVGEIIRMFNDNNFLITDELYVEKGGTYLRLDRKEERVC